MADPPQHLSGLARSPILRRAYSPDAGSPPSNPAKTLPRPLFPPTTLIIGDSITRNIHFFNATTCCFPGATVPVILGKPPGLLQSVPCSITRIVVHVGTNDLARGASELIKSAFTSLLPRGFNFADNFNLFWNRPSFFKHDGIHPTTLGSHTLAANIQHAVHHAPHE
ncbi:hypothetical protein ABVT39_017145 [Epinephelus coioides]